MTKRKVFISYRRDDAAGFSNSIMTDWLNIFQRTRCSSMYSELNRVQIS